MPLTIFLCIVAASFVAVTSRNVPSYERQALHDLYLSTNGDEWKYQYGDEGHWNFTDPDVNPCSSSDPWQGLNCSINSSVSEYNYISAIELACFNLIGTIPETIGNFSKLNNLNISYNLVIKTLPNSIYRLADLRTMDIRCNKLRGQIPEAIRYLKNLTVLILGYNDFTGTIPEWIGDLPYLTALNLVSNQLTGSIPSKINSNLSSSLIFLSFGSNELTGTIPDWIGDLHVLSYLNLSINHLNGSIPTSIGELSQLQILHLDNNQFSGILPSSFSRLISISQLCLSFNFLVGDITDIFNDFQNLSHLILNDNLFDGPLPISISRLYNLNRIFLQNNVLSGNLESVFNGNHLNLEIIQLSNNQFTGELPEQLFLSSNLISMSAVSNCFHGTISSNICLNKNLETLALDGLVCASSCQIKILPGISSAYVSSNSITGGIPPCLLSMPQLKLLHISGNGLTGTLPSINKAWSTKLRNLSVSHNFLTGTISNAIQSNHWTNLDLSYNRLSGTLLSSFNSTSNKSSLTSSNNRLSGFIPFNIQYMINIDILEGNNFDCKFDRSDLPSYDKDKVFYECGSNRLNYACILWQCLLLILILTAFIMWYFREKLIELSIIFKHLKLWLFITSTFTIPDGFGTDNIANLKLQSLFNLKQYLKKLEIARAISFKSSIAIIVILLPVYAILNKFYYSHTFKYAWTVSMIYLSGEVPFGIIFSLVLLIFIVQIYNLRDQTRNDSDGDYAHMITDDVDKKYWQIRIISAAYIAVNLIFVAGFNVCYIISTIYSRNNTLIISSEILLAIFKIAWNTNVTPLMIRWIVNYLSLKSVEAYNTLFFIQFVVTVLNNIVLPCLLILVISPNCYSTVFQPESDVTSTFYYKDCATINIHNKCTSFARVNSTTSYSPPFTYSYQCSADFITFYAPVFAYFCIILTIFIPLTQALWIRWGLPNILQFGNLFQIDNVTQFEVLVYIDEVNESMICELVLITLIMTFGVVFPPLAIIFFINICANTYSIQVIIGRYISNAVNNKSFESLDTLENNMKVQPLLSTIKKCGWFSIYVSFSFYTLFLFDTLADNVGFKRAYWVLFTIPCMPLCIHMLTEVYTRWIEWRNNSIQRNDSNNIQMSQIDCIMNPIDRNMEYDRNSNIFDMSALDRSGDSLESFESLNH